MCCPLRSRSALMVEDEMALLLGTKFEVVLGYETQGRASRSKAAKATGRADGRGRHSKATAPEWTRRRLLDHGRHHYRHFCFYACGYNGCWVWNPNYGRRTNG